MGLHFQSIELEEDPCMAAALSLTKPALKSDRGAIQLQFRVSESFSESFSELQLN